ncbi:ferrochelatase [Nakamurella aerolata]|uniref:Coproporphyrin III ferrochelatase n=1 Tax=Nakamurella aerolata TaxID=1656892 RepID=A0A849AA95_9ACTN|nr:ferrochelatase [Nakamurella aerolata]NNG36533.1 ferrochelatase [Nakamurella aerolata]
MTLPPAETAAVTGSGARIAAQPLEYDAVLLAGFGGPEGQDDVIPFLRNVTAGRGVPEERLEEVAGHYRALGGVSPINEQNRLLQQRLQEALIDIGIDLPVLWGNRNWDPYLTDVVRRADAAGHRKLLAVATSAYSSYSSCRQYREDFGAALRDAGALGRMRIDKVAPYFDQPGFLDPFVDGTLAAIRSAFAGRIEPDELRVLFTTHSIPTAMADTSGSPELGDTTRPGGAYVAQHLSVARYVMAEVRRLLAEAGTEVAVSGPVDEPAAAPGPEDAGLRWQLVYQSRSGSPSVPWLEPDINEVIAELPDAGVRGVVVVPIGFVSDHVEVIWDLDNEAAQTAADLGLAYWRVATPGTDARFVAALAESIARRLGRCLPRHSVLDTAPRPDFCAAGCCVNPRAAKPTTAAVDSATDWPADTDPAALAGSGFAPAAAPQAGSLQDARR